MFSKCLHLVKVCWEFLLNWFYKNTPRDCDFETIMSVLWSIIVQFWGLLICWLTSAVCAHEFGRKKPLDIFNLRSALIMYKHLRSHCRIRTNSYGSLNKYSRGHQSSQNVFVHQWKTSAAKLQNCDHLHSLMCFFKKLMNKNAELAS